MSHDEPHHESPERPERQTEQENQQYPEHGRPDEQRRRVGLPDEGEGDGEGEEPREP